VTKLVLVGLAICCTALLSCCGKEERPTFGKKPMAEQEEKVGPKQEADRLDKIHKKVARAKDKIKQIKPGKQARVQKYVEVVEKHLAAAEDEMKARQARD
jgi:hypothetical protein